MHLRSPVSSPQGRASLVLLGAVRRHARVQRNGGDGTGTGAQLRRPDATQSSRRRVSTSALPNHSAAPNTNKINPANSKLASRRSAAVSRRPSRSGVGPRGGRSVGGRSLAVLPVEFVPRLTCSSFPSPAHRFLHRPDALLEGKWLGEKIIVVFLAFREVLLECLLGIAGYEDNLDAGIAAAQLGQQGRPVHLGHHHVGHHKIDLPELAVERLDPLAAARCLTYRIAPGRPAAPITGAQSPVVLAHAG